MVAWETKLKYRRFVEKHPKFPEYTANVLAAIVLIGGLLGALALTMWLAYQFLVWVASWSV